MNEEKPKKHSIVMRQNVFPLLSKALFGLVSLFNGISTFAGYLMPKLFS